VGKSAKKQQSQVQTIHLAVTCRNVAQVIYNLNKVRKNSHWFFR